MYNMRQCPFCAGSELEKEMFCDLVGWLYRIRCKKCDARVTSLTDMEHAIRLWNTRPVEESFSADVERMRSALADMCKIWEVLGKQIPAVLAEPRYISAKTLSETVDTKEEGCENEQ